VIRIRLLRRPLEHPLLKPGQHLIRQHVGGFADRPRLQLTDPPVQQQTQGRRQPGTELFGVLQPRPGRERSQTQRRGDLFLGPPFLAGVTLRDLGEQLLLRPVQPGPMLLHHQQRIHLLGLRQPGEVGRAELGQTQHRRPHGGQVIAHIIPEIQRPGTGQPHAHQVRSDRHPAPRLPLQRQLPVRVVLQRRQLPPGEVHINPYPKCYSNRCSTATTSRYT
jgi:hypothetical protein